MRNEGILIVVSGFSGAGKGTLMKRLVEEYDGYSLSISATTREPRPGEEDGREYFFLSREQFEKRIADHALIEHAEYCGNYYGTPKDYVERELAAGRDVILEIEIQGALKIKEQYPDALLLFVSTPDAAELRRRLSGRGTETAEVIRKRLGRAAKEAEGIEAYDYIVINDDLETCVRELHGIIAAAHHAPGRNEAFIKKMRRELEGE
ncbi:MAG: guanylate kinase [Lachnospiraceae bacterium]|jgi:guanylate kinase|nr:guanylate kinase [Lachnospiraceae bacterium]RKI77830.1 guanylate kinase [bacterium 1xD42-87]